MSSPNDVVQKSSDRWVSLADKLNPARPTFDPQFKETWKKLDKASRKKIVDEDKRMIRDLQQRGKSLPFPTNSDDHCETSKSAYSHIVPLLQLLAKKLKKSPKELRIYDPYYCAGAMVRHLNELGFPHVHNQPDDFYKIITSKKIPPHDILITNPPYSGDHFDRLKQFLSTQNCPHLLLVPDHFEVDTQKYTILKPKERYHYWTPLGMRPDEDSKQKKKHRNLMLGSRNSPFPSKWCVSLEPFLSKSDLKEVVLDHGCTIEGNDSSRAGSGRKFRQRDEKNDHDDDVETSTKKFKKSKKA